MAMKKAEKNKVDEAVQRKNKVNTSVDNEIIIIDDDENDSDDCSDLQTKVEVKKKKDLVKGKGIYHKGTKKKKKKKNDSDKKNKAGGNLIITESSSDLELLTKNEEVSKIVKKKGEQRLPCEEDGNCEVFSKGLPREQQGPNFLFSHSSKRKSPDSNRDGGECIKKMKKKKKKKHKPTSSLMLHSEDNEAEFQKLIIPNIETISQDITLSERKKRRILVKNNVSNTIKEKNLLDYIIDVDNEDSSDGISEKRIANPVYHLQEENHCKRRTLGCKGHQDSVAQVLEEETRVIKKKQKKKKTSKEKAHFVTATKNQQNNSGISNNLLQLKSRETQEDMIPDSQGARRVTSRKTIYTEDVSNPAAVLEDSEDASAVRKRKKKVKKCKAVQECRVGGNSESSGKRHRKKKRKNKERRTVDGCEEEPSLKKGRLKKETKEASHGKSKSCALLQVREDEIKVVAFKKGNCDEINIDKSRRQALQEEIDRESGKTKVIKEERELESGFGQWSTATFETSERKSKFLRLLGGFKKGSSVSSQDSSAHTTKLNMALDWNREQNLQQDLQAEFEKAVDRKHHRGTGLGFQSAMQKHTHIDKYASKSIKFEA